MTVVKAIAETAVTDAEFTTAWEDLAASVREYDPAVTVLIARKAPRMQQALGLDFGAESLLLSDLGVPFAAEALRNARVAIVDDVVNVGSTLQRACQNVLRLGAHEVKCFAITRWARSEVARDIVYVLDRELDRERLREFGRLVPRVLRLFDKPYDLDFPVLRCTLAVPFTSFADLFAELQEEYGENYVYDLSTPEGVAAGVRRMTIDFSGNEGSHRKVRIFFNERGYCHVVPLDIAPVLKTGPPSVYASIGARTMYEVVAAGGLPDHQDALARLRMYCESLSFGEQFLAHHPTLFRMPLDALDLDDAAFVLGPRVRTLDWSELLDRRPSTTVAQVVRPPKPSPFFAAARASGLVEATAARLDAESEDATELEALVTLIETLALWVGADDPSAYRLGWPYEASAIARDPYLRLHIGPTMTDILGIVGEVLGRTEGERDLTRREITRYLDRLIDSGAIVPTTATYDGRIYRIYRKGEGTARDIVSNRIRYALAKYQEMTDNDLVPTLMTKILTMMTFTEDDDAHPGLVPRSEVRGTVASYPETLLDQGASVFHYLLHIEGIKRK